MTRSRAGSLVFLALLVSLIVSHGIRRGEFDYNVDESQHAATGLFFADLLKDHPIFHPIHYTYIYYAQYPALSGVIHWPPVFYVCEGLTFFLFGASVMTARLTVLLFALAAWFFWFRFIADVENHWTALLSTLLLACLPSVLLFEKTVMLEIPSLAFCIAALYYWYRYLSDERRRDLYIFAVFASCALLTKQNALFLAPVCALTVLAWHKWNLLFKREMAVAVAIVIVLTGPFYTVVYLVHWKTIAMDLLGGRAAGIQGATEQPMSRIAQLLFYWKALPEQLTWPVLLLSAVGIASCRWWSRRETARFMLLWIFAVYVTFTVISHKEDRYVLYWIPPFTYFAAGPLTFAWRTKTLRIVTAVCAVILGANVVIGAWMYQRPFLEGYSAVARAIVRRSRSGIILFDGDLPANFIFFLHSFDPERRFLVLRKSLWVTRGKVEGGSEELVHGPQEIRDVVDRDGVKYIVVSDAINLKFGVQRTLRTLLDSDPQFRLLASFPITTNEPEWKDRRLLLYQNQRAHAPTEAFLRIRMMTLSHDIVIPWSELRRTW